jgi:hypothetical protein
MAEPKTPTDPPIRHDRDTVTHADTKAGAYFERSRGADLGTTIIRAVAAVEGVSPESLADPPLYEHIDVEHLEKAMFGPGTDGSRETTVTFPYRGHHVHVRGDGYVYVTDPTGV